MTEQEAIDILKSTNEDFFRPDNPNEFDDVNKALELAIKALEVKEKVTEIVNRQLIAGKNNYKEIYDCFYEIVKVVQDNY